MAVESREVLLAVQRDLADVRHVHRRLDRVLVGQAVHVEVEEARSGGRRVDTEARSGSTVSLRLLDAVEVVGHGDPALDAPGSCCSCATPLRVRPLYPLFDDVLSTVNSGESPWTCGPLRSVSPRCAERVVADVQHPLGEVPLAGDREVPREEEVVALDLRVLEHREDVLVEVRLASRVGAAAVTVWRRSRLRPR